MENETSPLDALALAEVETTCLCLNVRKMARVLTHAFLGQSHLKRCSLMLKPSRNGSLSSR